MIVIILAFFLVIVALLNLPQKKGNETYIEVKLLFNLIILGFLWTHRAEENASYLSLIIFLVNVLLLWWLPGGLREQNK